MSFLSRLFGTARDPREAQRPLWHRIVELAREEDWYADLGVEDTIAGRFDMITAVLALVLLRMEREDGLAHPSVYLTELFVEDMDAQLREAGVGDQLVGKHVGRLMSVLGGRLGTLRDALAGADDSALCAYAQRNVSLAPDAQAQPLAAALRALAGRLEQVAAEDLLAGRVGQ